VEFNLNTATVVETTTKVEREVGKYYAELGAHSDEAWLLAHCLSRADVVNKLDWCFQSVLEGVYKWAGDEYFSERHSQAVRRRDFVLNRPEYELNNEQYQMVLMFTYEEYFPLLNKLARGPPVENSNFHYLFERRMWEVGPFVNTHGRLFSHFTADVMEAYNPSCNSKMNLLPLRKMVEAALSQGLDGCFPRLVDKLVKLSQPQQDYHIWRRICLGGQPMNLHRLGMLKAYEFDYTKDVVETFDLALERIAARHNYQTYRRPKILFRGDDFDRILHDKLGNPGSNDFGRGSWFMIKSWSSWSEDPAVANRFLYVDNDNNRKNISAVMLKMNYVEDDGPEAAIPVFLLSAFKVEKEYVAA